MTKSKIFIKINTLDVRFEVKLKAILVAPQRKSADEQIVSEALEASRND
jgi:hypothetical protein